MIEMPEELTSGEDQQDFQNRPEQSAEAEGVLRCVVLSFSDRYRFITDVLEVG